MAKRGGRSGRKYVRDNRGRFATTGATARGGRLKTASGKKRATQTVKTKTGGKPAGAIKGKIKRDPGAAKPAAAKPAKRKTVNTSGASFERRRALAEPKVAANRRLKAEASRPLQFSGKKAGGKADQLFNDKVAQASYNRQRASEGVAARARRFYDGASQFYSAFSDRPRYSTIRKPAKDAGQWSSSSQSAWSNDLRKRRKPKRGRS